MLVVLLQVRVDTSHVSLAVVQSWHEAPPSPHALERKPAWQVPSGAQQPLLVAQLVAQGMIVQAWAWQTLPSPVQFSHCAPPVPHDVSESGVTHVSGPTQQPLAHVVGLQVGGVGTHEPPMPASAATHEPELAVQSWQVPPKFPQTV